MEKKALKTEEIEKALASDKPVIVPYAYSPSQEYTSVHKDDLLGAWFDYDGKSNYPDDEENDLRMLSIKAENPALKSLINVRSDGFVRNLRTGGIYYANEAATTVLSGLLERDIASIKKTNPNILEVLRIDK